MNSRKIILLLSVLLGLYGVGRAVYLAESGRGISWERTLMEGSRTGVKSVTVDNLAEALGVFDGETYVSPNGRRFTDGVTPPVAASLMEVQPKIGSPRPDELRRYPYLDAGGPGGPRRHPFDVPVPE